MSNGKFPVLYFANSGYCDELGCSYFQGRFEARSQEQYDALKPYAEKVIGPASNAPAPAREKPLADMRVSGLRELAIDLGIANPKKMKKYELIKAIENARNPQEDPEDNSDPLADQENAIELEGGE
jgi:hypothetical protein